LDAGIDNVKIVVIGKSQYSSSNADWTEGNSIPIIVDPLPYSAWSSWDAGQRDLFFFDSDGNYVTDFNISIWDYDRIYNTIIALS